MKNIFDVFNELTEDEITEQFGYAPTRFTDPVTGQACELRTKRSGSLGYCAYLFKIVNNVPDRVLCFALGKSPRQATDRLLERIEYFHANGYYYDPEMLARVDVEIKIIKPEVKQLPPKKRQLALFTQTTD